MVTSLARRLGLAAAQAPSVHNTQPWRLTTPRGEFAELHADWDRWLRISDPRGRSLHVSCGAALFNVRLSVRLARHKPLVWLLPSPDEEPEVLAAVRVAESGPPTEATLGLYQAIPVRRTNRQPFTARRIPPHVLAELRAAAAAEGASLLRPSQETLDFAALAEDELALDAAYQAELATAAMPSYVHGPQATGSPDPIRDFGHRTGDARFETEPQLAVLATPGDGPLDWLRAGQALQRVLLTATVHGISASFLNQPLDLRDMRRRNDPPHRGGHPQMIMRLGYGPAVPRAPRRALDV
ncbi:Acg family FMN-binding oxidoreductase [Nonomuraea soli]|uniref:Nitroreductase n=1 Tax=Nonomuraea soli TaxID=1032476 RepID=A0A7W0CF07_9ACTN|nr:nitroreductase family protein [Nonomuraea soli]MBA2889965.1 nitroreductase [Nonomuraea soli]